MKVLRMGLPIVENLSGLCGNIFNLSRRPQLRFGKKSKNCWIYIRRPLVGTRLCGSACQSCLLAILYHSGVADLVFLHIVEF